MVGVVVPLAVRPDGSTVLPIQPVSFSHEFVLGAGVALAFMLALMIVLSVGRSLQRFRQRRRNDELHRELQNDLLDRLYGEGDPEWETLVETLSERERSVLESLLEEYLRELKGEDAETLAGLGDALGIGKRARRLLRTGDYYERLQALTWLMLLREQPDIRFLERYATSTPRERAAAARILYVSGDPDFASDGVDLLLRNHTDPFTVFGIDTLYRVAEQEPSRLFERAGVDYRRWEPALQEQVLLATRHLSTLIGRANPTWITDLASSPVERTRVEAVRALGGFGWNRSLREQVDLEALFADPSPAVRASAYRMLGEWGDEDAVTALLAAAEREENDRARIAAAEALLGHQGRHGFAVGGGLADAWAWVAEHDAFDDRAIALSQGEADRA